MVNSASYILPGLSDPELNERAIIHAVCKVCGKKPEEMREMKECRKPECVFPRQLIVSLINKALNKPLSTSSNVYEQNHATCIHSVRTIRNWYETDHRKRETINKVLAILML